MTGRYIFELHGAHTLLLSSVPAHTHHTLAHAQTPFINVLMEVSSNILEANSRCGTVFFFDACLLTSTTQFPNDSSSFIGKQNTTDQTSEIIQA
jgi:hypothetical protein